MPLNDSAAVAAIKYALETEDAEEFLRYWNEGEFDVIRRNWENVPEAVFIGADPLHPATRKIAAKAVHTGMAMGVSVIGGEVTFCIMEHHPVGLSTVLASGSLPKGDSVVTLPLSQDAALFRLICAAADDDSIESKAIEHLANIDFLGDQPASPDVVRQVAIEALRLVEEYPDGNFA